MAEVEIVSSTPSGGPVALVQPKPGTNFVDLSEITKALSGEGVAYQRAMAHVGSSYRDSSTIVIVPTREPLIHYKVSQSWQNLIAPMNQARAFIYVVNDEVGVAYTKTIQSILADPTLSKWKYIMTMESDNIVPPDAHIRLLETIEKGKFDGVSGLYWTKGEINQPMAYGDPAHYMRTGELEFKPRDVRQALAYGQVMPVNGIAMGCSLYRMDLFRDIEAPWFVTLADVVNGSPQAFTQDLYFCRNAVSKGKRFAVDMSVKVGHIDPSTSMVY